MRGCVLFLAVFSALSCSSSSEAQETFNSVPEMVDFFVTKKNEKYGDDVKIDKSQVVVRKKIIDKNSSDDVVVYHRYDCGSKCKVSVFLCLDVSPGCESGKYCYVGEIKSFDWESDIYASLRCKVGENGAGLK